jgi:hypothetical protein
MAKDDIDKFKQTFDKIYQMLDEKDKMLLTLGIGIGVIIGVIWTLDKNNGGKNGN